MMSGQTHPQAVFSMPGCYDYTVGPNVSALDVTLSGAVLESVSNPEMTRSIVTARLTGLMPGQVLRIIIGGEKTNKTRIWPDGVGNIALGDMPDSGSSALAARGDDDLAQFTYLLITEEGESSYIRAAGPNGIGLANVQCRQNEIHHAGQHSPGASSGYAILTVALEDQTCTYDVLHRSGTTPW